MLKKIIAAFSVVSLVICFSSCGDVMRESSPLKESDFISSGIDEDTGLRYDEYEEYVIVTGVSSAPDNIIIPDMISDKEVHAIADEAFREMGWVQSIEMPDTVLEIGENAFYGCVSVQKITLSENLYSIGTAAFFELKEIESVRFPMTLKKIGGYAFAECTKLKNVVIPSGVESIGGAAFAGTEWLSGEEEEFVIVGDGVLISYNGTDEKVTLPENVKEVSAFADNLQIQEIVLNESVLRIGDYAFINSPISVITLTEGIEEIGKNAFDSCIELKEINLNSNLEIIEEYAFSGCTALCEITLPENLEMLGGFAFSRCSGLEKITFLSADTQIGEKIGDECEELKKIACPKKSPAIDYAKEAAIAIEII